MSKLYNINTDKIEDLTLIEYEGANIYASKISTSRLNSMGYFPIRHEGFAGNRRYHNSTRSASVINNVYVITYDITDKPVEEVQTKMLKDLNEVAESNETSASLDTGLGFTVRAGRNDLDSFERGAKRNLKEVRDINGVKRTITVPEMAKIAEDIETQGMVLFETKWNKFDEIKAFTTVAECILYEATPYIVNEEVIDELGAGTGIFEDVTKYKNNVKDW